jgi:hypothetical protein
MYYFMHYLVWLIGLAESEESPPLYSIPRFPSPLPSSLPSLLSLISIVMADREADEKAIASEVMNILNNAQRDLSQ